MKFSWQSPDDTGRMGILAEPQQYDAHPFPTTYLMDSTPLISDPGHVMAASLLLFGAAVSGEVELPQAVSPEAAAAAERFLGLPQTSVQPIAREPKAIPKGTVRCVALHDEESFALPSNSWGEPRWFTVREMRSDIWSGTMATTTEMRIPTNGHLHRQGDGLQSRLTSVACAVLVAVTMQATEIVVPSFAPADAEWAERVSDLLSNVGLGFSSLDEW